MCVIIFLSMEIKIQCIKNIFRCAGNRLQYIYPFNIPTNQCEKLAKNARFCTLRSVQVYSLVRCILFYVVE